MKKRIKQTALLVLSCASLVATAGYSSWIVQSHKEYALNNRDTTSKPVAYIVGNDKVKYTSIEKALDVAKSGDIVLVIPPSNNNYHSKDNNIVPDKVTYHIKRNCEIKAGVSLVVPTDLNTSSTISNSDTLTKFIDSMSNDDRNRGGNYSQSALKDSQHYLRVTIEVDANVTLTNNGRLVLSGYMSGGNSSSSAGPIGRTTHSYSQILLNKNAKIIQSNSSAKTYCFGFISEKTENNGSKIAIQAGQLLMPLVIYDYRGFTFSVALTGGAMSKQHCSPFNQFGLENIDVSTSVSYEGSVVGISNLYAKYQDSVNKNFHNLVLMIGKDSSAFIQLTDADYSSVNAHFYRSTNVMDLVIEGGINLNNIDLKLKATNMMSISFSTVDSFLPVTNMYHVTLSKAPGQAKDAVYNFSKQRVKLLPGSKMRIKEGCKVTASDFIVYSAFYDGALGNGETAVNDYDAVKYPLTEGGELVIENNSTLNPTSFGGIVYTDSNNAIDSTIAESVSKEAWNVKSTGKINPPWTADDYLEIREKTKMIPTSYLSKKKIYCGMNIFTENSSFLPVYDIIFSDGTIETVSGHQTVIFCDKDMDYSISFKNNIYSAYSNKNRYAMNSSVNSSANNIVGVINSGVSISSDNNGKNEFEVHSIKVNCSTPLIDDKAPLYVDSAIQLRAAIDDIDKCYDKTIKWSSSDNSIAVVDQNGKVTGKKLGKVTIFAECGGVTGQFETEVIVSQETTPISTITITDSKKDTATMNVANGASQSFESFNSKHKYENNQNIDFTLSLNDGAKWSAIEWTLHASAAGRQYLNDPQKKTNVVTDVDKITLHTVSGTGASDDGFNLVVKVTELGTGKTYTMTLNLLHKADAGCFEIGTKVLTSRGYVPIESIHSDDKVVSFNHLTGSFELSKIAAVINHGERKYKVIELGFDDGTSINFIDSHGLFDVDQNEYIDINPLNFKDFIGHRFVSYKSNRILVSTLIKAKIKERKTISYTLVTSENLNCVSNGLLNITSVLKGVYNIFDYDNDFKFDANNMKKDIDKYGLYEYSDFEDLITEKIFIDYGFKYFKVSIGKKLMTYDTLLFYIRWLKNCISNGEAIIY